MATAEAPTRTTFVYLVEGEPHVGTVEDYAKALAETAYAGFSLDERVYLFGGDGSPIPVKLHLHSTGYDEDDYSTTIVELRLDGCESASVRIDGRA